MRCLTFFKMFDQSAVFSSYNKQYERKNRVQVYQVVQVNSCASICTARNKYGFRSLRKKMIKLVLVIKYHFYFRLQFGISKKMHFPRFYRNFT